MEVVHYNTGMVQLFCRIEQFYKIRIYIPIKLGDLFCVIYNLLAVSFSVPHKEGTRFEKNL